MERGADCVPRLQHDKGVQRRQGGLKLNIEHRTSNIERPMRVDPPSGYSEATLKLPRSSAKAIEFLTADAIRHCYRRGDILARSKLQQARRSAYGATCPSADEQGRASDKVGGALASSPA